MSIFADESSGNESSSNGTITDILTSSDTMNSTSDTTTSTLSDSQEIFIAWFPFVPTILSIFGSSVIIYQVLWKPRRRRTLGPYKRIMLGVSIADILATITQVTAPFFSPAATSRRYYAIGNDFTCVLSGTFTQLSFSTIWYNGFLSCYFVLKLVFHKSTMQIANRYEPVMHFIAIGYNALTAISGAMFDYYGESAIGPGCWIVDEGKVNWPNGWVFGGIPVLLNFSLVFFNNLLIYCHLRKQTTQRGRRRRRPPPPNTLTASTAPATAPAASGMNTATTTTGAVGPSEDANQPNPGRRRIQFQLQRSLSSFLSSRSITTTRSSQGGGGSVGGGSSSARGSVTFSPNTISIEEHQKLRSVATQSTGYLLSWVVCYLWPFIIKGMESFDWESDVEEDIYGLFVIQAILLPLQGFLNMMVYCRPKYIKLRGRYPDETKGWCLKHAILDTNLNLIQHERGTVTQYYGKVIPSTTRINPTTIMKESTTNNAETEAAAAGGGGTAAAAHLDDDFEDDDFDDDDFIVTTRAAAATISSLDDTAYYGSTKNRWNTDPSSSSSYGLESLENNNDDDDADDTRYENNNKTRKKEAKFWPSKLSSITMSELTPPASTSSVSSTSSLSLCQFQLNMGDDATNYSAQDDDDDDEENPRRQQPQQLIHHPRHPQAPQQASLSSPSLLRNTNNNNPGGSHRTPFPSTLFSLEEEEEDEDIVQEEDTMPTRDSTSYDDLSRMD